LISIATEGEQRRPETGKRRMLTLAESNEIGAYLPIFLMILAAIGFGVINLVGTFLLGPRRAGARKGETYESGMTPVGTARKRFNIRFYLIAMVFLVFDVEVIFLYPWAQTFTSLDPMSDASAIWLLRILFFLLTTLVAYLYGYRKGVFKFD
jgi:NADH-quinone oxidoreductase subunit A